MRGVAKQRKMAMKVGQAWCDKGFHFTAIESGQYVTYGGRFGDGSWPNSCRTCVRMYEDAKTPVSIADDDPNGFYAELGIEALGKTG
jgi:hypothetical protein